MRADEWYKNGVEGLYKDGEKQIARSAYWSGEYAFNVIKGRFRLGEKSIARNVRESHWYALNVVKGRFIEGEEAMRKDGLIWYEYKEYLKDKGIEI